MTPSPQAAANKKVQKTLTSPKTINSEIKPRELVRYNIQEFFHPFPVDQSNIVEETVGKLALVKSILDKNGITSGDILIFMPTVKLIQNTMNLIYDTYKDTYFLPLPLHRTVETELQDITKNQSLGSITGNLSKIDELYSEFNYSRYNSTNN